MTTDAWADWHPTSARWPIDDRMGHRRLARLSVMTMVDAWRHKSIDAKSRPAIMLMPTVWKYPRSMSLVDACSCGPPDSDTQSVPDGINGNADVCDALSTPGRARSRSSVCA